MSKEEEKKPQVNPVGHNDMGSPLNTGSNVKSGHHNIQEDKERTNDQDGNVVLSNTAPGAAIFNSEKTDPGTKSFDGNNDPGANKTQQPGPTEGE